MINKLIDKFTNNFTETIFFKKGTESEEKIKALRTLLEKYPENKTLLNELKICEVGLKGEKEIEYELKNANIGMYVLHDVNMEYKDLKAQIDYIIITPAYTYFVECKKLLGDITVNPNGDFIREYYYGRQKKREGIYSPLRQAERHVEIFKKIWMDRNTGIIDKLLRQKNLDTWYKPLVVFANTKGTLNIKYAPKEYKNKIIRSDNLIEYLKKDIEKCDKDLLYNKEKMHNAAYSIMKNYNKMKKIDYITKYEEMINNVSIKDEKALVQDIKNKLIEYRKNKAKEKNIPAYFIFNNDELDKILKLLPKNIEELKNSNILSKVKIDLHGKEIVEIINL